MSDPNKQCTFCGCDASPRQRGALLPSGTSEWSTPWPLFKLLDSEFAFTVDAAASPENAKCERYYTLEINGLLQSWAGERVWVNPPYDQKSLAAFMSKAVEESHHGAVTVLLVPVKADQGWWHEIAIKHELRFIRGRVAFGDAPSTAPMPVCIVVVRANHGPSVASLRQPQTSILDKLGEDDR